MNVLKLFFYICVSSFILCSTSLKAQISEGGLPPSFNHGQLLKSSLKTEVLQTPDPLSFQNRDRLNDSLGLPYRIAEMLPADFCMNYSGKWDTLSSGEIIWRLKINLPGALGIQLTYDNFFLPTGSKLYLYSEDKQFVIGAFTEKNNNSSKVFATEIISGDVCILEYVQSQSSKEEPRICISKAGYVYRGMVGLSPKLDHLKYVPISGACEVNINCSPEGDNWKAIKRSVVKVNMNGVICSGTLLNNTSQNFKNYFATAFHCITGHEKDSLTWIFYFNYELSDCSNSSPMNTSNTLTGADIRAEIPINNGGDGVLLELKGTIPDHYNVYWAGWDRTDTLVAGGVGIHHPLGDVKKISTIRDLWRTDTWFSENTIGARGAHWNVPFTPTSNGYGVTEKGSSGSGLFGPDERFRGQLTGGSSTCDLPGGDNLYGKLSFNWDKYGALPNVQFKKWLDPTNTGLKKINGIEKKSSNGVFWTSSLTSIYIDSAVNFYNESKYNPTTWSWTFEGGVPSTSDLPNPKVIYPSSGIYDVSLTVKNDSGTFTKTRTDYVYVKPKPAWTPQKSRFPEVSRGIDGFSIVDSMVVWAWAYDGIAPNSHIMEYTKTINGGAIWVADSIVIPGFSGYGMGNMYAINKDTAYASVFAPNGGGSIVRTFDGGKTWATQPSALFSAPNGFPNFVYFFDHKKGICGGDPNNGYFEVYTTINGGTTWSRVPSANLPPSLAGEAGTSNMYAAIGDTIWFGTTKGRVYRSTNKGLNWTMNIIGVTVPAGSSAPTDVKFRNAKVGFAISQSSTDYTVKKTVDGGDTWANYPLPTNFVQGKLAYIKGTKSSWMNVGSGYPNGSSFSINDGDTYSSLDNNIQYTAVGFYNKNTGWAGGFNIDSLNGGIYKWDQQNTFLTSIHNIPAVLYSDSHLMHISPNPVITNLNITCEKSIAGNINLIILNTAGSVVSQYHYQNLEKNSNLQIDINNLSPGVYILILESKNTVEKQKFIKL